MTGEGSKEENSNRHDVKKGPCVCLSVCLLAAGERFRAGGGERGDEKTSEGNEEETWKDRNVKKGENNCNWKLIKLKKNGEQRPMKTK